MEWEDVLHFFSFSIFGAGTANEQSSLDGGGILVGGWLGKEDFWADIFNAPFFLTVCAGVLHTLSII